jgi:hypothetical protein
MLVVEVVVVGLLEALLAVEVQERDSLKDKLVILLLQILVVVEVAHLADTLQVLVVLDT